MSYEEGSSLSSRLKRLDHHSAVQSEFRVQTSHGALLSILTLIGTYVHT